MAQGSSWLFERLNVFMFSSKPRHQRYTLADSVPPESSEMCVLTLSCKAVECWMLKSLRALIWLNFQTKYCHTWLSFSRHIILNNKVLWKTHRFFSPHFDIFKKQGYSTGLEKMDKKNQNNGLFGEVFSDSQTKTFKHILEYIKLPHFSLIFFVIVCVPHKLLSRQTQVLFSEESNTWIYFAFN